MKKLSVLASFAVAAFFSTACLAQSGGVNIPGLGNATGSVGFKVKNNKIMVSNNKAASGQGAGGSVGAPGVATASMTSMANVNSVNVTGSQVSNSTIAVTGNTGEGITAAGGVVNANSVNIN